MRSNLRVFIVEDGSAQAEMLENELQHKGFQVFAEQVLLANDMQPALAGLESQALDALGLPLLIIDFLASQKVAVLGSSTAVAEATPVSRRGNRIRQDGSNPHTSWGVPVKDQGDTKTARAEPPQGLDHVVLDAHGVVTYWNDGAVKLFGWTAEEMLGRDYLERFPPAARPRIAEQLRERTTTDEWVGELEDYRKDGSRVWIDLRLTGVTDPQRPGGTLIIAHDISARKRLEEQYRQAQKMEAIGQLAGGVAHDFNNLIHIITGYSSLMLQTMSKEDPAYEMVKEIKKAGERSASLTRQLLAFSRKQMLAPEILDLNAIVGDMEKMLRRLIGEDVDLTTLLDPTLNCVKADPGQIQQVLLNLALNARDAMPQGGKLTIETKNVELCAGYHPEVPPALYAMLAVTDTGSGMSADIKQHIFEPFFTTKETGKGTGMGLAVVHGIIKQSSGHVAVYSEPGIGTSFKVYLPGLGENKYPANSFLGLTAAPRGSETILLVEDEEGVRTLTRYILQDLGYNVLEAGHGESALELCTQFKDLIHLLVTDVVMPVMGGRQLARKLVEMYPGIHVLYLSGYTEDAIVRHGILQESVHFLHKPFSPFALAQKVRDILGPVK